MYRAKLSFINENEIKTFQKQTEIQTRYHHSFCLTNDTSRSATHRNRKTSRIQKEHQGGKSHSKSTKKNQSKQWKYSWKKKTVGQGHYLSITTLNFNAISSPIKRYRLAEWV